MMFSHGLRNGGAGISFLRPSPRPFADSRVSVVPLSRVRFAPSLMFIATTALVRFHPFPKLHAFDLSP